MFWSICKQYGPIETSTLWRKYAFSVFFIDILGFSLNSVAIQWQHMQVKQLCVLFMRCYKRGEFGHLCNPF